MAQQETGFWPALTATNRPWTRWWWMGSAVTREGITAQLEAFQAAGIGGVEISPIYGVKGAESLYKSYLAEEWVEMLAHTLTEAERLGMGVDMIEGTGWPFGGPWVETAQSAHRLRLTETPVQTGTAYTVPATYPSDAKLQLASAIGVSASGTVIELPVNEAAWTPPPGRWTVYAAYVGPTGQQVKRAAPGGGGNVLDHFDANAVAAYLAPFDAVLARLKEKTGGKMLRCLFNDSWEVYGANTTPTLWAEFERRRGYDLRKHLHHLKGDGNPEIARRVRADYRQTVADLTQGFLDTWTQHAHKHGAKSRNQAHGSPGNLLDLYALSDIPETEMFGATVLQLVGLEPLPGTPVEDTPQEQFFISKMAASAGNVTGKPLVSSESFTWLGEHFQTPLEHLRAEADLLFAAGINHLFFHGTPYSPPEAAWPGWLFYASTHFGPTNTFWHDLPALNEYMARCQSLLQSGVPNNDILLYFPFDDILDADAGTTDLLQFLSVHGTEKWMRESAAGFHIAQTSLWKRGWLFDSVSDRQLTESLQPEGGKLKNAVGTTYRAVVVPGCRTMPPETAERLREIARAGVPVLFAGEIPSEVCGLLESETRRQRLQAVFTELQTLPSVRRGSDIEGLLRQSGLHREMLADAGTHIVRRRLDDGHLYFLHHIGTEARSGWVELAVPARSAVWMDAGTGRTGAALLRHENGDRATVFLRTEPGESLFLRTYTEREAEAAPFPFTVPAGDGVSLDGPWQVEFLDGGPTLPAPRTVDALTSWTQWTPQSDSDREALHEFSGTVRYRRTFDAPPNPAENYRLELGRVCHSARVRLNGTNLGTVYARPWQIALPPLRPTGNILEIEVTNLMANRLAALDRSGADWQKFFFVNINYKPFSAKSWEPLPSGLLGPVRLVPQQSPVL